MRAVTGQQHRMVASSDHIRRCQLICLSHKARTSSVTGANRPALQGRARACQTVGVLVALWRFECPVTVHHRQHADSVQLVVSTPTTRRLLVGWRVLGARCKLAPKLVDRRTSPSLTTSCTSSSHTEHTALMRRHPHLTPYFCPMPSPAASTCPMRVVHGAYRPRPQEHAWRTT